MARLKKGSAAAKAWGRRMQALRNRRSSSKSKVKTTSQGVRKTMAKKRRYRRSGMTLPIAPLVGLAAGLIDPIDHIMRGDFPEALNHLSENYTGYNTVSGTWNIFAAKGLPPLVAGLLVHKFVGGKPLNFNAALARAKVPLIRI